MYTINISRWYSENANITCKTRVTSNQFILILLIINTDFKKIGRYRTFSTRDKDFNV